MESAHKRFEFRAQAIESGIRARLGACEFLLQSGAALIAASGEVTRKEWRTYVTELKIDKFYQGVQGVGFSKRILPLEKKAHIRQIREEGFPNYDIQPDGERAEYTSIIFLEPFDLRNQRAFGYDMFSEPTRKEAMVRARDTGLAAMSRKVTLVQETDKDVQAGYLMYLPVYRKGEVPETPEQRLEMLTGYVYSPFRMNDFMQGLLQEKLGYVELQIFDGDEPLKNVLLYTGGDMESFLSHSDHPYLFTHQSIVEYAGRRWLLIFKSSPYFEETIDTKTVNVLLLFGITVSLLSFAVLLSLTKSHNQATSLANMSLDLERTNLGLREKVVENEKAREALRESEETYRALLFNIPGMVYQGNPDWSTTFISNVEMVCGYLADEFNTRHVSWMELIHPDDRKRVVENTPTLIDEQKSIVQAYRIVTKDGSIRWVSDHKSFLFRENGSLVHIIGIVFDITERKHDEEELKRYSAKLEKKNKELQDAIANVKQLTGMLPICASCKQIRDDKGYWNSVESYIAEHSEAVFSHGICPECEKKMYGDLDKLITENA
jgi:PAS domain S-box-containing protein